MALSLGNVGTTKGTLSKAAGAAIASAWDAMTILVAILAPDSDPPFPAPWRNCCRDLFDWVVGRGIGKEVRNWLNAGSEAYDDAGATVDRIAAAKFDRGVRRFGFDDLNELAGFFGFDEALLNGLLTQDAATRAHLRTWFRALFDKAHKAAPGDKAVAAILAALSEVAAPVAPETPKAETPKASDKAPAKAKAKAKGALSL